MKKFRRQIFVKLNVRAMLTALIVVASFAFAMRATAQEVDTSVLDARIKSALLKVKSSNATVADKRALVQAYLARANIYYIAGIPSLYKLALGDFRRALRYDPKNAEAREKAEMIVSIYKSMSRPVPVNGNDPNDDGVETKESVNTERKSGVGSGVGTGAGIGVGVERRIHFAPGRMTRTLKGSVARNAVEKFTLNATAGQKLSLRLASPDVNVSGTPDAVAGMHGSAKQASSFRIVNARTREVLQGADNVAAWSGEIVDAGNYIIEITTTQNKISYALIVTLDESVEIRSY